MKKVICTAITLLLLCITFISAQAQFQTSDKVAAPRFYKHKVRVNENMQTISSYYAVSTGDLSLLNNIAPDHKLKPGDIVLIRELKEGEPENVIAEDPKDAPAVTAKREKSTPETAAATTATASAERKSPATQRAAAPAPTASVSTDVLRGPDGTTYEKSATAYHIVEKGQTFYRITKIYGLTAEQLMSMNNLSTTVLEVGQKLKVAK
jgi:membrane-bound lytic murein transglycosylase D